MVEADARFDALIIGAGFSGLYTLHRLRQLGLRTRVLEIAENVGGTWLYNRHLAGRRHRSGSPVLQLLVQRWQCARQETDVHGLYRRNPRIPAPLR
jgi:cation diffusion facilitator CzcD-associated flavoprotein CzcO